MKTLDLSAIENRMPGENGKPGPRAIPLLDSLDRPVKHGDAQIYMRVDEFLLGRTGNPKFVQGLEGVEAVELQLAARKAIKDQLAIDDGLIVLEDAPAARLVDAILHPQGGYNYEISHNLWPFLSAAKKLHDGNLREARVKDPRREISSGAKADATESTGAQPAEAPAN